MYCQTHTIPKWYYKYHQSTSLDFEIYDILPWQSSWNEVLQQSETL